MENAIRHGLPNGGTVILSTRAENDAYLNTLANNDIGLNCSVMKKKKKRNGIGLGNVQARLQALCGGTLSVDSSSEGTPLTIRIPKPANPDEKAVSVRTGQKTEE